MRIGLGYDCHRFMEGDHVYIGGIKIPHTHAVQAHSDGDVLLHAIIDALLGAAGLGDIGQHFPDSEPKFSGIRSAAMLLTVLAALQQYHYRIVNVDVTVIAEAPKLTPHREVIRARVAELLGVSLMQVNLKATTNEKMGWIGRGEGLAAQAVVLLES